MSCYLRHIKDILEEADIEVTAANRKQLDQVIHQMLGVSYKDCPETWKRLKQQLGDEQKRQELLRQLRVSG